MLDVLINQLPTQTMQIVHIIMHINNKNNIGMT